MKISFKKIVLHMSTSYLPDPPGKPGKPEILDYDKNHAEINWTAPKSDGGSPITKYVVEKRPKGGFWEKVSVNYKHFSDKIKNADKIIHGQILQSSFPPKCMGYLDICHKLCKRLSVHLSL